ncbi:MAG: cohesin domain-containing protein [Candidatus Bathyarchaeia archaeon]
MKGAKTIYALAFIMLISPFYKMFMPQVYAIDATVVVNPSTYTPSQGQTFNITVEVQNVNNLASWQLELFFDPTLLTCTNYTVPLDNIFGAATITPTPIINNTLGRVFAFTALDGSGSVNGSGIMCRIEFQAKIPGISFADIRNEMNYTGTYLADPANALISFTATDGIIKITAPSFQENIYQVVVNSTTYTFIIYSNSTISNFNYYTNATIKYMATAADGTKGQFTAIIPTILLKPPPATLINNVATYCTFSDNVTHLFVHCSYSHSIKEIEIRSTIPYDVDGNRIINMLDIYLIALHFGELPSNPNWNSLMDTYRDGIINMLDLFVVAINFGKEWKP